MFSQTSLSTGAVIQVFHEDHITSITKGVGLFVVKVFLCCRFGGEDVATLSAASRSSSTLLFSRQPALQQFQLALQLLKRTSEALREHRHWLPKTSPVQHQPHG
jgi:hypothetical protein